MLPLTMAPQDTDTNHLSVQGRSCDFDIAQGNTPPTLNIFNILRGISVRLIDKWLMLSLFLVLLGAGVGWIYSSDLKWMSKHPGFLLSNLGLLVSSVIYYWTSKARKKTKEDS